MIKISMQKIIFLILLSIASLNVKALTYDVDLSLIPGNHPAGVDVADFINFSPMYVSSEDPFTGDLLYNIQLFCCDPMIMTFDLSKVSVNTIRLNGFSNNVSIGIFITTTTGSYSFFTTNSWSEEITVSGVGDIISVEVDSFENGVTGISFDYTAVTADESSWKEGCHEVLSGDYNNDGISDFYLKSIPESKTLTIPYGIDVDVITTCGVADVVLQVDAEGGFTTIYPPDVTLLENTIWSPSTHALVYGDFDNDGFQDVLVQAQNIGETSFSLLAVKNNEPPYVNETVIRTVAGPDGDYTPGARPPIDNTPANNYSKEGNSYVGKLNGSFSVTSNGKPNYSIPIEFTPSRQGIAPNISLAYNGGSGNDILGVGWHLEGLSKIERCGTTLVQDTYINTTNFNSSDKFCLNGQRLVAVSGTYGASNTEYRTENESFTKIVSNGISGNGPQYFTVYHSDGKIEYYGRTSNSRQLTQTTNTVVQWGINSVEDRDGSFATFNYQNNRIDGEFYVQQIDFNGNSTKFIYEPRLDITPSYARGLDSKLSVRLDKIETYQSSSLVRQYDLDYAVGNATERSRLVNVKECLSDGCKAGTSFTWDLGNEQVVFEGLPSQERTYTGVYDNEQYHLADVNADGRSDLIRTYQVDNSLGRILYTANTNGVGFTEQSTVTDDGYLPSNVALEDQQYLTGDINGDGRADLVYVARNMTDVYRTVYLANDTGTGFVSQGYEIDSDENYQFYNEGKYQLADVNGDGRQDLVWAFTYKNKFAQVVYHAKNNSAGKVSLVKVSFTVDTDYSPNFYQNNNFLLGDVNGDGKADLVWTFVYNGEQVTALYLANANGTAFEIISMQIDEDLNVSDNFLPNESISLYLNQNFNLGDVNADGKADLVWTFTYNQEFRRVVYLASAKGTSLTRRTVIREEITGLNPANHESTSMRMADLNGDGRSDLVYTYKDNTQTQYGYQVFTSEIGGETFKSAPTVSPITISLAAQNQNYLLGDLNADGKTDLVWAYNTGTTYHRRTFTLPASHPDHIVGITDGFGLQTNIHYRYLADNATGFYTKDNSSIYPVRDDSGLSYLVDHIEQSDGIGGMHSYDYTYAGAKTNLIGRGFTGFRQRQITDNQTGFVTTETYQEEFPFIGLKQSVVVKQANGTPLEKVFNHWRQSTITHSGGSDTTYRYLKDTVAIKYDLNGASVLADVTVDNYNLTDGTLTNRVTATGSAFSGAIDSAYSEAGQYSVSNVSGLDRTITTAYTYNNNVSNWRIGFVATKTATYSVPGTADKTINTSYSPVSSYSFLVSTEHQFGTTDNSITNTYGRDFYGNVTSLLLTGKDIDNSNIASRRTRWGNYQNGMYPESTTNALGHATLLSYNPRVGKQSKSIDPNGLIIDNTYDDFGRLVYTKAADGTDTQTVLQSCGNNDCPKFGKYKSITTVTHANQANQYGSPQVTKYFDALHRELRTERISFNGNVIRTDTKYNTRGRVEFVSQPYFVGNAIHWTQYAFDALSRITNTSMPNGGSSSTSYSADSTYATRATTTQTILLPISGTKTVTSVARNNSIEQLVQSVDSHNTITQFAYDALGNMRSVVVDNNAATTITMESDLAGNKTYMADPDAGEITYEYNSAGELRRQTQGPGGLGHRVVTGYDSLGRAISKDEFDGTTTVTHLWEYDTAVNGIGLLAVTSNPDYSETIEYDAYSRIGRTSTQLLNEATPKVFRFAYDGFSRKITNEYPSGLIVSTAHNSLGYTKRVRNKITNKVYREVFTADAYGNVTEETFGNGYTTKRKYDPFIGKLIDLQTGTSSTPSSIQNAGFTYDSTGNLYSRSNQALSETFTYDNLSRVLTAATAGLPSGPRNINYDYDALGNITTKSDVSDANGYHYGENGAGVHAVSRVVKDGVTINYGYDAKGNVTTRGNTTITYAVFNKPTSISKAGSLTSFKYNPDREQFYRNSSENGVISEHFYYGTSTYEVVKQGNVIREKTYIGDFLVHNKVKSVGSNASGEDVRYLHRDHIGSVEAITDEKGVMLTRMAFDPYGKRRQPSWEDANAVFNSSLKATTFNTTDRGFTNHEHIDDFGLIQTKGRMYDPVIGRFISPDDFVQLHQFSQSYNRYSYVLNNPLTYTDESGEFIPGLFEFAIAATITHFAVESSKESITSGVEDAKTVIDTNKTDGERVLAGMSLATRVVSGGRSNNVHKIGKNLGNPAGFASKFIAKAKDFITTVAKASKTVGSLTKKVRGWFSKKLSSGKNANNSKTPESKGTKDGNTENSDLAKGGTYKLEDSEGVVKRTGLSNDLKRRRKEHARKPETKDLDFVVDKRTDDPIARRGREQIIYDKNPQAQYKNGGLNKRRPISLKNKEIDTFIEKGKEL